MLGRVSAVFVPNSFRRTRNCRLPWICVFTAVAGLALPWAAGADSAEEALKRYMAMGVSARNDVARIEGLLAAVRAKCDRDGAAFRYKSDADVAALLQRRIPAAYLIGRELAQDPKGQWLEVLLYCAAMAGWRPNARCVAAVLEDQARPEHERWFAAWSLGVIGGSEAAAHLLAAIEDGREKAENVVAMCCKGLGLTGDKAYLPVMAKALRGLRTPLARCHAATAMAALGDDRAANLLRQGVADAALPTDARRVCVAYVRDHPQPEAVTALARVAAETTGDLADDALEALLAVVLFGDPQVAPDSAVADALSLLRTGANDHAETRQEVRDRLVGGALAWWERHQERIVAVWGRRNRQDSRLRELPP